MLSSVGFAFSVFSRAEWPYAFAFVIVFVSTIGGGSKRNKKVKGGNDDHRD